ncbi:MAG: lamin tail domain-containing protein [Balneola sp.]
MKRILLSFGLCLLMAGMSFGQSAGDLIITEIMADPSDVTDSNGEYFEIYNATNDTIDISGFKISDATGSHTITGTVKVAPKSFFVLAEEGDTGINGGVTAGYDYSSSITLNNGSETLSLSTGSDVVITTISYTDGNPFGAGVAMELSNLNDASNGTLSEGDLVAATANVDGTGSDLGSPGNQGNTVIDLTTISGDAGWRLLSIPKTSATVSDISDDTAIQGVAGGSDTGASSNVFTYDNTGSYETPSNVSTAITDGYGLAVYFYNNTTNGSSALPLTLDVSGSEPSSDVGVTLNKSNTAGTSAGSGAADSYYTLVGNPFASNYNLNSISVTGGAIQDNVQFWNDGTSSYSAQSRTTPYIVSPWQAFWVEVLNANAATSITFPTSGKSTSSPTATYFSKENSNNTDIKFTLSSATTFDEAIKLSFRSYAEVGMDRADASKLVPLVKSYATMAFVGEYQNEEKLKSVESLPTTLEEAITIPLRPTLVGVSGEFTFSWEGLEALSNNMSFTLHDYETGANIDMTDTDSYVFIAEANTAAKSNSVLLPVVAESESNNAENRFGITIAPGTSVSIDDEIDAPTEFTLGQNYPNPFNPTTNINYSVGEAGPVNITVYNVMGQKVAELLNTTKNAGNYQITWNATGVASGIYYYRLTAPGQVLTRQMTLIK